MLLSHESVISWHIGSPLMRMLPVTIDDSECYVLVRRAGCEYKQDGIFVRSLFDELIGRRFGLVDEVWVEDVEFITLHHFRWWVIRTILKSATSMMILMKDLLIVRLVILVPLISSMHTIEIPRLPWSVFILPGVGRRARDIRFATEYLLFVVLVQVSFSVHSIRQFPSECVNNGRSLGDGFLYDFLFFDCLRNETGSGNSTPLSQLQAESMKYLDEESKTTHQSP
jgi:hypothetical protein